MAIKFNRTEEDKKKDIFFKSSEVVDTGEGKRKYLFVTKFQTRDKKELIYVPRWDDFNTMLFGLLNIEKEKWGSSYSPHISELLIGMNKFLKKDIKTIASRYEFKEFLDTLEDIKLETHMKDTPDLNYDKKLIQIKYEDGVIFQISPQDYEEKFIEKLKKYKYGKSAEVFWKKHAEDYKK